MQIANTYHVNRNILNFKGAAKEKGKLFLCNARA